MKKLVNLIKGKYLLTTLILLGSFILFAFIYAAWDEAKWSGFGLSSWIMFLVNSGLVALIVIGLFTNKKEFVAIPFTIFGVACLYNLITATSGISYFFNAISHLGSGIRNAKNLGFTPRVDVPTIIADLIYGSIGLAALGGFVCLVLGKVVLKNEKLTKIASIVISLISVGFVALGLFSLISTIVYNTWTGSNDYIVIGVYDDGYYIINCLSRASLWAMLALVTYIGLPEKAAKKAEEPKKEEVEAKEEPTAEAESID